MVKAPGRNEMGACLISVPMKRNRCRDPYPKGRGKHNRQLCDGHPLVVVVVVVVAVAVAVAVAVVVAAAVLVVVAVVVVVVLVVVVKTLVLLVDACSNEVSGGSCSSVPLFQLL